MRDIADRVAVYPDLGFRRCSRATSGIRVRDGISTHGLALNVDLDVRDFDVIAPCGMPGLAVTSLRCEGAAASLHDVAVAAAAIACRHLASALVPEQWIGGGPTYGFPCSLDST